MELFSRVDLSVPPSSRFGISVGREVEEALHNQLSPLAGFAESVTQELHFFATRLYRNGPGGEACSVVFNHALNDYIILVNALWDGDGRSAARTARSLYEHLVNYCYIAGDVGAAERYQDHKAVTFQILSRMLKRLPLLGGTQRKREAHRRKKMGTGSAQPYRSGLDRHGKAFKKDWAQLDLYSRAKMHGLESDYDTYRLFSQVTHGSAGGALGTLQAEAGPVIHRTGPSLELAILAFPEGISFFRDLCVRIHAIHGINADNLVRSLNELIAGWGTYKRACEWVDKNLWPDSPPLPGATILAIYPAGGMRWLHWEPSLGLMAIGVPPSNAVELEQKIKGNISFIPDGTQSGDSEGRPITAAVHGVAIQVPPGAKWMPAEAILIPGRGAEFADAVFNKFPLIKRSTPQEENGC
ncbi:DUF5677 domain-containing protein [Streptomyces sp. NPDC017949]|uniref:DUF5677 domain-containing protein n=1 Tax=Streptomyces sp. NPDC017949 TaxID=3365020 RepID=UPI003789ADFE